MKVLVCDRPGSLSFVDRPDPQPGPDDVVLRIRRVGVCGTDLHIFQGKHPFLAYPRVMGHELAGEIVQAPPGSALGVGEAALVVPYLACNACRACRRGRPNCCERLSVLGVHQDGGMAEYLALPREAVMAAEGLSLDDAAMVEFLAIGAHGVARAAVGPDDRVLVVGAGPIGMAALIFARAAGATVAVVDTRGDRRQFARRRLGADADYTPGEAEASEAFDVVIDATGQAGAMRTSLDRLAHAGRFVLLGVVRDDVAWSDPELHKRETTLLASRNALPADFARVIASLREGAIPTAALRTHSAPLDTAARHFPDWILPESGVIKAMIHV